MITRKWKESFMVWYREWGGAGWVGRVGCIVYIGTGSIAKTIVQAQRGMLFNSHSFWHTPLAGCGGRVRSGIFRSPSCSASTSHFCSSHQRGGLSGLSVCVWCVVRIRTTMCMNMIMKLDRVT